MPSFCRSPIVRLSYAIYLLLNNLSPSKVYMFLTLSEPAKSTKWNLDARRLMDGCESVADDSWLAICCFKRTEKMAWDLDDVALTSVDPVALWWTPFLNILQSIVVVSTKNDSNISMQSLTSTYHLHYVLVPHEHPTKRCSHQHLHESMDVFQQRYDWAPIDHSNPHDITPEMIRRLDSCLLVCCMLTRALWTGNVRIVGWYLISPYQHLFMQNKKGMFQLHTILIMRWKCTSTHAVCLAGSSLTIRKDNNIRGIRLCSSSGYNVPICQDGNIIAICITRKHEWHGNKIYFMQH